MFWIPWRRPMGEFSNRFFNIIHHTLYISMHPIYIQTITQHIFLSEIWLAKGSFRFVARCKLLLLITLEILSDLSCEAFPDSDHSFLLHFFNDALRMLPVFIWQKFAAQPQLLLVWVGCHNTITKSYFYDTSKIWIYVSVWLQRS